MSTVSRIDEKAILVILERAADALRNKDLDALGKCYTEDVRIFDIGSESIGFGKFRELWEACLPDFPDSIETRRKDVKVTFGDGVAVVTGFVRMSGMKTDHPCNRAWIRTTTCLRKFNGHWKIFHEHASMPVDCTRDSIAYLFDED